MPGRKTVSIEVGENRIRVTELTNRKWEAEVHHVLELDTPKGCVDHGHITNPQALGDFLHTRMQEEGIRTVSTVFSVISDEILISSEEIPGQKKKRADKEILELAQECFGLAGPREIEPSEDSEMEPIEEGDTPEASDSFPEPEDTEYREPVDFDKSSEEEENLPSVDDYIIEYTPMNSDDIDDTRVMIYAAPRDLIESYYDLAEEAGLNVRAIDFCGNSIYQWMKRSFGHEAVMMVQMRRQHATVTVINDEVLLMQKNLSVGVKNLLDLINERQAEAEMEDYSDHESMTDYVYGNNEIAAEAGPFAAEIKKTVADYLAWDEDEYIDKIVIAGEGDGMMILAAEVQKAVGIPTFSLEDIKGGAAVKDETPFEEKDPGEYLSVMGAVIAPLGFRLDRRKSAALSVDERQERITRIMIIVMIAALIALAVTGAAYLLLHSHHSELESQLEDVEYMEDIYDQYKEAEEKNSALKTLDDSTQNKNEILSGLYSDLEGSMPNSAHITSMNVADEMVIMSIETTTKEDAAKMILQLRDLGYLTDLSVSGLTDVTHVTGVTMVNFTVTAYISGEASSDPELTNGANDSDIYYNDETSSDTASDSSSIGRTMDYSSETASYDASDDGAEGVQ